MEIAEKNLAKLQKLLNFLDEDALTKEDFVKNFELVIKIIQDLKKSNETEFELIHQNLTAFSNKLKEDNNSNIAAMKKETKDYLMTEAKKIYQDHEKMMAQIDDKLAEVQGVLTQIKLLKQKEVILDGPKELRDKLETLKDEDRLDKEAVRGLEEEIKGLKTAIAGIPRGKNMGRVKVPIMRPVNLTSSVDGSTRSFTLPPDTTQVIGVWGSQFPFTLDRDNDWTLSGNVLTLGSQVATPQAGQTLWVLLEVLFYP